MTFWDNCADTLAIYSLSDMLVVHSMILTKTKPWTTVSGEFQGNIYDLLHISKVNLVYLGENRFARLWKKDDLNSSSHIGPNYNFQFTPLPVTPAKPPKPAKPRRSKPKRSAPPPPPPHTRGIKYGRNLIGIEWECPAPKCGACGCYGQNCWSYRNQCPAQDATC